MAQRRPEPLEGEALMDYALRALSRRAMSTSELRAKLLQRAADPAGADHVIARLEDPGVLNDARFAESYATARLENQGFGRMRVLRDLRRRRVPPQTAESAVGKVFEDTDESKLAEQYLLRKYRNKNLHEFLSEEKNLASAFRRLVTAGFAPGPAIRVLKRYAAKADLLEEEIEDAPEE